MLNQVKEWAEHMVYTSGYSGITILMILSTCNIPIPSEFIMPVGGFLAADGRLSLWGVTFAGTVGTVIGSAANYGLGAWLGKDGLTKYGKFLMIRPKEIHHAETWFGKYGPAFTLWGRFIPVVRSFVSLAGGLFRMSFSVFVAYAFIGGLVWSYLWTALGFYLKDHWEVVEKNTKPIEYAMLALIVLVLIKFIVGRFKNAAAAEALHEEDRAEAQ